MSTFPQVKDYRIIRTIGQGSTSTVYLAHAKENIKSTVAIKVIERGKLSKSAIDAVITEIGVTKKLKHKHIVQMIDFSWDSKHIYIILEHCDGGDLSTFIKQHTKLTEKLCHKLMQQLALALRFLRSHNVSHLDLKPQNLLLKMSPQLTLKVGDFGLAKFMSENTQIKNIRGSPLYMAPEMLLHTCYDVRADLWSVGVIAYECIYGHAPYASDSLMDLLAKVKKVLPIEISDDVSPECRDLLLGLLKHNPSERLSYDQFFNHPFLDLEHAPCIESFAKGVEAIHKAVKFDREKQYKAAFCKYCIALQYLVPYFQNEADQSKIATFQLRMNEYTKRADELKAILKISKIKIDSEETADKSTASSEDDVHIGKLIVLCQNTPQLASAVEIAISGQMYLIEGQYEAADEKFKIALNLLEKLLEKEPPGIRYNLLIKQINYWKSQYENAIALLQSKDQKVSDKSTDVADGSLACGKTDKKSSKFFKVVSKLISKTKTKNSLPPEKK